MAIPIFFALSIATALPVLFASAQRKASQEPQRARRLAEHRLNARLVAMNL